MSPTHTTGWRPAVGVVVEVDHNVFGEGVVVDGAFVAVSALFAAACAFGLAVAGPASARAMSSQMTTNADGSDLASSANSAGATVCSGPGALALAGDVYLAGLATSAA